MDLVPPCLEHAGEKGAAERDVGKPLRTRSGPSEVDRKRRIFRQLGLLLDRNDYCRPVGRLAFAAVGKPARFECRFDFLPLGIVRKVCAGHRLGRHRLHEFVDFGHLSGSPRPMRETHVRSLAVLLPWTHSFELCNSD